MNVITKSIAALTLVLFASVASFAASEAGNLRHKLFQQLLENQQMRILEIELAPGEASTIHSHPDHQAFAATDGTLTVTTADGETKTIAVKAGDAIWQLATTYETVNSGGKGFKAVIVENK
jgi:quercetin dioxygenase-like cupin family protein